MIENTLNKLKKKQQSCLVEVDKEEVIMLRGKVDIEIAIMFIGKVDIEKVIMFMIIFVEIFSPESRSAAENSFGLNRPLSLSLLLLLSSVKLLSSPLLYISTSHYRFLCTRLCVFLVMSCLVLFASYCIRIRMIIIMIIINYYYCCTAIIIMAFLDNKYICTMNIIIFV